MLCRLIGGVQSQVYLAYYEADGPSSTKTGRGEILQTTRISRTNKGECLWQAESTLLTLAQ